MKLFFVKPGFKDGLAIQWGVSAGKYDAAERIVISNPIFFYGLSGRTKLLVDRGQASYMRKYKRKAEGHAPFSPANRKGFFLCAGATRGKRLFDCPVLTVRYFFDAIDVEYAGEVCFREIEV